MGGTAAEILTLWEAGTAVAPDRRGSALAAALAGTTLRQADGEALGRRDRHLLEARQRLFGESIEAQVTCPDCGAAAELAFSLDEVLSLGADGPTEATLEVGGCRIVVTPPGAAALAGLDRDGDLRTALAEACVISCTDAAGAEVALPTAAVTAVAAEIERLDPLGAITMAVSCPDCGSAFEAPFDPAAFLGAEIDAAAERLFLEIDQLARAYGWTEAEILALSPARRRAYLERQPA